MIELQESQYEVLLSWAQQGSLNTGAGAVFFGLRKKIDAANSIERYTMVIRYELLPQTGFLGITEVPRGKTITLEQKRPVTKEDVLLALQDTRFIPNQVFVTSDPLGEIGFYELEAYPWSG